MLCVWYLKEEVLIEVPHHKNTLENNLDYTISYYLAGKYSFLIQKVDGDVNNYKSLLNQVSLKSNTCMSFYIEYAFILTENLCDVLCSTEYSPVCGTNGKTYNNTCYLDIAICYDPTLQLASDGECTAGRLI